MGDPLSTNQEDREAARPGTWPLDLPGRAYLSRLHRGGQVQAGHPGWLPPLGVRVFKGIFYPNWSLS